MGQSSDRVGIWGMNLKKKDRFPAWKRTADREEQSAGSWKRIDCEEREIENDQIECRKVDL